MRVSVVTPYFPNQDQPHRGHSTYQTLLRMAPHVDMEVLCPMTTYPRWAQPKNYPYARVRAGYQPPGGIVTRYIEYPALPLVSRPVNGLVCAHYIRPHLERFRPDVILNYWLYPEGWAAVHEGRRMGVPVVAGAIGSDLNRIPDRATRWWTRRTLCGASFLITVSEHLRRQAIALGMAPERSRRVINGSDTRVFHPAARDEARRELGLDAGRRIVLFVGWLSETKGLRELARVLPALAARHPDLQAVAIGEGPMRAELEALAGSGVRVLLPGQRPSAELARWYAACDVFCLPSWAEGCPNVVVEALACGRPVVATRVGGVPELVDAPQKGILVEPRDAAALEAALGRALSEKWDEAAIAGASARDWSDCARETETICREVSAGTLGR